MRQQNSSQIILYKKIDFILTICFHHYMKILIKTLLLASSIFTLNAEMHDHYLLVLDEANNYPPINDYHYKILPQETYDPAVHQHNDHEKHVTVIESAELLQVINNCILLHKHTRYCDIALENHFGSDDISFEFCRNVRADKTNCGAGINIREISGLIARCLNTTVVIVPKHYWENGKTAFCQSVACDPSSCINQPDTFDNGMARWLNDPHEKKASKK